jgi:putative oxidoreductase
MYLFLLGRILLGGYFLMNAYNHFKNVESLTGYAQSKGVGQPKMAVLGTGVLLLVGGAGIVLGIFVAWAVLALVIFLAGVTFKMHQYWKITDPMQKMAEQVNFMKNLALLGAVIMLLAIPTPWVASLF